MAMMTATVAEEPAVAEVGAVISEQVDAMPPPDAPAVEGGVGMLVTTASEDAQAHVRWGLTCLHAGWDFEAYRHFCAALKADGDCLMAHWGAVVSLLQAGPARAAERGAAMERMMALVDAGQGTDLERRYAYGLVKLATEGVAEAADAFARTADEYPRDAQARMLRCLFGRGGYDEFGDATPDQERAVAEMREVVKANPESSYLLYGLLAIRAEAPDLSADLPEARRLVEMGPGFAPYQHLLGHYEWRCGNHEAAQAAFLVAADAYSRWMKAANTNEFACPGWTKAQCYRAVALSSTGRYETALALAEVLTEIEVPAEQAATPGGKMLLWEAATLPVRICMRRSDRGVLRHGLDLLPGVAPAKAVGERSLAPWSWQVHASVASGHIVLKEGNKKAFELVGEDLARMTENAGQLQELAMLKDERSEWTRAAKALELMSCDLRGMAALAGPPEGRGSAFNWFRAAADRQRVASLMMPPMVLVPMELRLASYFGAEGDWDRAVEELEAGARRWPNDYEVLKALAAAYAKVGKEAEAAEVEERLSGMGE